MVRPFVTPRATGSAGGRENARWPKPGAAVQHGRHKSRDWPWQGLAFAAAATQWGAVKTAEVTGARGCSAAEYCAGAGAAAEHCTGAEECVVGSTAPVRRGSGATGARPAEVYWKKAGAAAEYCTGAEECVEGSTAPVRRGGRSYRGEARGSVL